jgi:hypothetical protein
VWHQLGLTINVTSSDILFKPNGKLKKEEHTQVVFTKTKTMWKFTKINFKIVLSVIGSRLELWVAGEPAHLTLMARDKD